MRAVGKVTALLLSVLWLCTACQTGEVPTPNHQSLSVDTAWTGDTIVRF